MSVLHVEKWQDRSMPPKSQSFGIIFEEKEEKERWEIV